MHVRFNFMENICHCHLDKFTLILGANNSGKTRLLKHLQYGFDGLDEDDFFVNGQKITKGHYKTIFISAEQNFSDELKLGAKSQLKKELTQIIKEHQELFQLQPFIDQLEHQLQPFLHQSLAFCSHITPHFDASITDFIFRYLTLTVTENQTLSTSQQRLLYFDYILSKLPLLSANTCIFFDHFDLGLSLAQSMILYEKLKTTSQQFDGYFILTSSLFHPWYHTPKILYQNILYPNIEHCLDVPTFIASYEKVSLEDVQSLIPQEEQKIYWLQKISQQLLFEFYQFLLSNLSQKEYVALFPSTHPKYFDCFVKSLKK